MTILEFQGEYRFLSNFTLVRVTYEDIDYPSTEHAYQAAKSIDCDVRQIIAEMPTPGKAKRAGKNITIREDWDDVKLDVMLDLTRLKFENNEELRDKLLATGDQKIIEGNTWGDTFWGVCNGAGTNHLGNILMRVRLEMRGYEA